MIHQGQHAVSKAAHGLGRARPALASTRSPLASLHNSSGAMSGAARAASSLSRDVPEIFDIFDAPPRMLFEDADVGTSAICTRTYRPSHFRPRASPSTAPSYPSYTHTSAPQAPPHSRGLFTRASSQQLTHSTLPSTHVHVFDGPARPRNRPFTSARHRRSASTAPPPPLPGAVAYEPQAPEVFAGPARPGRRAPAGVKKTERRSKSTAWVAALAGLFGLGAIQTFETNVVEGERETPKIKSSAPSNILVYSRERECVAASAAKPDVIRDEILPNVF